MWVSQISIFNILFIPNGIVVQAAIKESREK